jgi:hypothetical protein
MIRSKWARIAAACVVATGAVVAAGNFNAPAVVQAQGGDAATISASPSEAAAAGGYWTAERMASAVAWDAMAAGAPAPNAGPAPVPTGAPGAAGGLTLEGALVQAPARSALAGGGPVPADGPYPGPHATYYYGPRYLTYPISTSGKLFFTPAGGGSAWCSANVTVGDASNLNVIFTAGHCVSNGAGSFHSNWIFCPSYNSGGINPSRGCWTWSVATVKTEWHTAGNWRYDYAAIRLASCTAGVGLCLVTGSVASFTGGTGFAWNWGRDQHWHHFGYPGSPWDGVSIVYTTTEHRYDDTAGGPGPLTNSWGTAQTPGSSGSNLLLGALFSYGGAYTNSVVSYYYTSQAGFELQGPYFDTTACAFWKGFTGWTGTC